MSNDSKKIAVAKEELSRERFVKRTLSKEEYDVLHAELRHEEDQVRDRIALASETMWSPDWTEANHLRGA